MSSVLELKQLAIRRKMRKASKSALLATLLLALGLLSVGPLTGIEAVAVTVNYAYDSLGRLLIAYDPSGNAAVYGYDAVGNLLSITNYPSTTFTTLYVSSSNGTIGSNLTIYGTDLLAGGCMMPTVTINGVSQTVVSDTSTQIVVSITTGTTSGSVVVTCGTNQTTAGTFTVTAATTPTVTGFTPGIGVAGTAVTVNGANFQTNPTDNDVRFNDTPAIPTAATAATINTTTPNAATSGHVTVTTSSGSGTSSSYFFVPPPPLTVSQIANTYTATFGNPVNPVISTGGTDDLVVFDGTAGQIVSLVVTSNTFGSCNGSNGTNAVITIYNPDGSVNQAQALCTNTPTYPDIVLPTTGTYTILVSGNNSSTTGSLVFTPYNTPDVMGSITLGGNPVTVSNCVGQVCIPGQDMRLTFTGIAGQVIALYMTNNTFANLSGCPQVLVSILDPSNNPLNVSGANGCLSLSEGGFITLATTGNYSVFIDPTGPNVGSVTLQLLNLTDLSSTVNTSGTYAPAVLGDTPSSYWRVDETGPATAANAIPAITHNVAGPTSPDNAITLNGIASWLRTTTEYTNPSIYSIEVWFKTKTTQGGQLIDFEASQTGGAGSNSYDRMIYMTSTGQLKLGHGTAGAVIVTSPSSYADGNWHQAVGTYDGTTLHLYVDGAQVASTTGAGPQNFAGWWHIGWGTLGNWPSPPNNAYFEGSLGEVSVWNSTALTSTQVSNHYNAKSGGNYDSTVLGDSPTSYWKLNESSGATFADATNGGNAASALSPANNGLYAGGITYSQAGALSSGDTAVLLDGSSGYMASDDLYSHPPILSVECWFKTSTTKGGVLIGYEDQIVGDSNDRPNTYTALYMTNTGALVFGYLSGSELAPSWWTPGLGSQ